MVNDVKSSFLKDLFNYKLTTYITRRVASAVYLFYLVFIPLATLIGTYYVYNFARHQYLDRNFHWQLAAIWIGGIIIGFLLLIYTRLLIELNIAVVNVAENTEPKK